MNGLFKFLKTYLFVLFAGTAIVYFGVPLLGKLGDVRPGRLVERLREAFEQPAPPSLALPHSGREEPRPEATLTPLAVEQAVARPSRSSTTAPTPRPPQAPAGYEVTIADQPPPDADTSATFWGIVRNSTRCFNTEGEFLRHLPAGVLVEYSETYASSVGEVAKCRVWHENERWIEDVIISLENLVRFPGSLQAVDESALESVRRYYEIKGGLEDLEDEWARQTREANPYREDYLRIAAQVRGLQEQTESLIRQRDDATGPLRMQIADRLRAMQPESYRLREDLKAAQERYQSWQPPAQDATSVSNDPRYQQMQAELESIAPEAKRILGKN